MKLRYVLAFFVTGLLLAAAASAWIVILNLTGSPARVAVDRTVTFAPPAREEILPPRPRAEPSREKPSQSRKGDGGPNVVHTPQQPKSGEIVSVSADLQGRADIAGDFFLDYQVVEPGRYIGLKDSAYQKQWTGLLMNDRGEKGDKVGGDGVFTAELPAALQKHRRLIRYRIRAGEHGKAILPQPDDPQPNFAYFVYDGVPPWKGAINPKAGDPKLREPVTFSSEALQRVPVYHLIGRQQSVERAMWSDPGDFGGTDRNQYKHTGTMVYDGIVYDHIGFRARGGAWRHAMGKNMWKFNFLPGHRFEARNHYGQRYASKWDKLNLGACIQQGDYGMRGEQGMFEAVGFRLFTLAGTEASLTHWVHLRVVDQAEENPSNQYAGDFWGLYLAVENLDEHFLKEHELPAGNLYKMEFGSAKTACNGDPNVTNQADVREFLGRSMRRQQPDAWWIENLDLGRYYSYRSILECIHHYDIDSGKNYFYYRNPRAGKWIVLPWDIDLSWGDQMYGAGQEPFYRAGVLSRPLFRRQYQERLAEIRDLLFNPEQIGMLIDEHAAMISDPRGAPSLVEADRAKWDFNPLLASRYVLGMKAGQGKFYFANPRNSFSTMVKYMKGFAAKRANWVDSHLLTGYRPPESPKIAALSPSGSNAATFPLQLVPGTEPPKLCQWRLAEVTRTNSPAFDPREPWKYEIQALWEKETSGSSSVEIPSSLFFPGHTYRARVRGRKDSDSGWSRWSLPLEITVPAKAR